MNNQPVFILGCPRSGTTLLAEILEPSIYGKPFETHFITKYYKKLQTYGDISREENFTRLISDIASERYVMQWGVTVDPKQLYRQVENFEFSTIAHHLCMLKSKRKGYALWGDKTPHYTLDLEIICHLFPGAKYLHIVRDGRDVALSLLGRPWGPANIWSCAELWKRYHADTPVYAQLKARKRLWLLRYEDLLANPQEVVKGIYEFLGEWNEETEEKVSRLITKIKGKNYGKWKTSMNSRQIQLFESIASNTLRKFGYDTTTQEQPIGVWRALRYRLHEKIARSVFLFKLNVIDWLKIKVFRKQPFAE